MFDQFLAAIPRVLHFHLQVMHADCNCWLLVCHPPHSPPHFQSISRIAPDRGIDSANCWIRYAEDDGKVSSSHGPRSELNTQSGMMSTAIFRNNHQARSSLVQTMNNTWSYDSRMVTARPSSNHRLFITVVFLLGRSSISFVT